MPSLDRTHSASPSPSAGRPSRRGFLALGGLAAMTPVLAACGAGGTTSQETKPIADGVPQQLRFAVIGSGKTGIHAALRYRMNGLDLGETLGGTKVSWPSGFTASLPVMEAFKAGSVDFSFATATAVAYAVGGDVPIVPLAAYPLPGSEVEILVPRGSGIRGAADLKGARIADQKGTTGTYSLIKYLETAGLRLDDVDYVDLPAADAESAFANGKVDAWISWQPAIGLAKARHRARSLPGVRTYDYSFYVASESFAKDYPEAVAKTVRAVRDAQRAINKSPVKSVDFFDGIGGFGSTDLEREVYLELTRKKLLSDSNADALAVVDRKAVKSTQDLADNFHDLGVYPSGIDVTGFLQDTRFDSVRKAVAAELAK
ncbi:NrtA/SsuA/CpmA family ABC transporter substrate-binding protein [Streptomyces sp. NRRL F-5135]|uniref:NrtA/SsuA/CpmA family ABC transporter substrate-binding protein n=1 Tax=Streptomyces sp. NRRL F-5135 TaxID=1463858 RepID=UPI0004C7DBCF|nr:NrtA/SsuA/CpmA family ABC transporter substrate-binding protein [Streptomyces sp. NRRL F-5135]